MDPLERVTVGYSTMCDMVQEIIGTERIMREGVKATDATLAHWEGERNAMMRALTYILAASGTARHRIGHAGHAYSADPYVSRYPLDNARERMIMEPVLTHLSEIMEFDHVITVHHGGTVTDGPRWLYAPDLHDEQLDSPSWSLLSGYTGAHGYRGPIMNNAEFIGGRLARDILDTPGHYVAIVATWSPLDGETEDTIEGWAVARYCGHVWFAGMMYVHEEDLAAVASVRRVECERCEYVPVRGRDY